MKILRAFLIFAALAPCRATEDWRVIPSDGRDYVSFANVAQFYGFPRFSQASRTVSLGDNRANLRAQAGTSEIYLNGIRFFCDFPLMVKGEDNLISAMDVAKIVEPVLRPEKITGAKIIDTIVLDPGHGGNDSGTAGLYGSEKNYTLDVAAAARMELLRAGFNVEMTRSGDESVPLEYRVAFANRFPRAVFVSLHFNSAPGGSGVETYAFAPAGVASNAADEARVANPETEAQPGNEHDAANIALAAALQGAILSRVSVFDRGVRHARFHVLRQIKIPGALVEAGFLNDPTDASRIATPAYRQQLGEAIAQGIITYNRAVNFLGKPSAILVGAENLPAHARSITEPLSAQPTPSAAPEDKPSAAIQSSK